MRSNNKSVIRLTYELQLHIQSSLPRSKSRLILMLREVVRCSSDSDIRDGDPGRAVDLVKVTGLSRDGVQGPVSSQNE
jgi:hypothetical protein